MTISGFSSAVCGLQASQVSLSAIGFNIAASGSFGVKGVDVYTLPVYNNSGSGAGVMYSTRNNIDSPGSPISTGIQTNALINGRGMFVVLGQDGKTYFTRAGDFYVSKDDTLINGNGFALMGWPLDNNGHLPQTNSLITSLKKINIQGAIASASATDTVSTVLRLNSGQEVAGDQRAVFSFDNIDANSPNNFNIKGVDVIYPSTYNSLTVGEGMTLKVDGTLYTFTYGGFAQTLTLPRNGTELVANGTTSLATDSLVIAVDGFDHIPFTRGNGSTNIEIMQNLVDQMNGTGGPYSLTARIVDDGANISILVAPINASYSMSFSGQNAFRDAIGLNDSRNTADASNTFRFASLDNLRDYINTIPGMNAVVSDGSNAHLSIVSSNSAFVNNYNPLGQGSNFLREFGVKDGYFESQYNPYDETRNMAGGAFYAHYTRDFAVYDSMGNQHNFLMRYLKVDSNKWAVEIHALNPADVSIYGRTDGLLMAGYVEFDGYGNLTAIESVQQSSKNAVYVNPSMPIGATDGQVLEIKVGSTEYSFEYNTCNSLSAPISGIGTELTAAGSGGVATDTLNIAVNGHIMTFTRGNGSTNLDVLNDLAAQINLTSGQYKLNASVIDNGGGNYKLSITPADPRVSVSFSSTDPSLATALSYSDVVANNNRFTTLFELANRINTTSGIDAITASVVPTNASETQYTISIVPSTPGSYMVFSGDTNAINYPLGNGSIDTIANALGLSDTSASTAVANLTDHMIVNWSGEFGAAPNRIGFNFGDIGTQNGLSQVASEFSVVSLNQNGVSIGALTSLSIDEAGDIVANFSNSKSRSIYKIAIADFGDINKLTPVTGSVFDFSSDAGELNLKQAGTEGVGTIQSKACEAGNIDSTEQLSRISGYMFVYQASASMLSTYSKMNDYLLQIIT